MGFSSVNSNRFGGRSATFQELATLIPQNSSPGLYNYISYGISQGYSKSQLLSATNYFTYLQANGFTTFLYSSAYYALRTFTGSTTFSNPIFAGATADVLVIAGGGGGASGGGGAGEMYEGTMVISSSVSITVGAAGNGVGGLVDANGGNGTASSIGSLSCNGGGGGGRYTGGPFSGNAGGSGGGGSINFTGTVAASVKTAGGYGFAGGNTSTNSGNGGPGGGGANGVGGNGFVNSNGADGGPARASFITGISTLYAGGGGGGTNPQPSGGSGGGGGAGNGGTGNSSGGGAGGSATANTGSGGGGTWYDANASGGNGGSGIVIIRFPITVPSVFGS